MQRQALAQHYSCPLFVSSWCWVWIRKQPLCIIWRGR